MITKVEIQEIAENLQVTPMNGTVLVLVPTVSETTETGIFKGDQLMEAEQKEQESFLPVIAVAEDVEKIKVGDRVLIQGNVLTFDKETIPVELDLRVDGYTVGTTMAMYVKLKV